MATYYGVTGYIQTSAVVFDRHVSETENQPRIITEQLFRLREPSINNETRTVTVTGQHVSYDLAGILCKNITITQAFNRDGHIKVSCIFLSNHFCVGKSERNSIV
jgi:hypothetical protein